MKELKARKEWLETMIKGAIATLERGDSVIEVKTLIEDIEQFKKQLDVVDKAIQVLSGLKI